MHAFEAALQYIAIKPTSHVMITGVLPTWHELMLIIRHLDISQGVVLVPQASIERTKYLAQVVDHEGMGNTVIVYQGVVDTSYGLVVKEESVDALVYVARPEDDHAAAAIEIRRVLKHAGIVAVIDQTSAHPLAKGIVAKIGAAAFTEAGFSLIHSDTVMRTHGIAIFRAPLGAV